MVLTAFPRYHYLLNHHHVLLDLCQFHCRSELFHLVHCTVSDSGITTVVVTGTAVVVTGTAVGNKKMNGKKRVGNRKLEETNEERIGVGLIHYRLVLPTGYCVYIQYRVPRTYSTAYIQILV